MQSPKWVQSRNFHFSISGKALKFQAGVNAPWNANGSTMTRKKGAGTISHNKLITPVIMAQI